MYYLLLKMRVASAAGLDADLDAVTLRFTLIFAYDLPKLYL
jgi:hypothetical protein